MGVTFILNRSSFIVNYECHVAVPRAGLAEGAGGGGALRGGAQAVTPRRQRGHPHGEPRARHHPQLLSGEVRRFPARLRVHEVEPPRRVVPVHQQQLAAHLHEVARAP